MNDLLDTAPCGFLSFADDGTILLTNATLRDRLGYAAGELEGKHLETILSVGGKVFYHTHFFPLLKMQSLAEEIYFSLRSNRNEDIPMLVNAVRRERDGVMVNDCIFVRMRQRRRYEDELLRAKKQAEQATAAKAKFLSMMSHDLRTPLQAISGFADVLLQGFSGPLTDDQREDVLAIKNAGKEMLQLMTDILNFAQLESGHIELSLRPVRLEEAVSRAASLLRPRFERHGLTFDPTECEGRLSCLADPDRLQQILLNLLTNAIKFTPRDGRISIRSSTRDSLVLIHVSDTGIGIPPERIADIFEPFVQVGAVTTEHGVGLGLSISRDLARAMGGDLTAESVPGKGSTFTIALRAVPAETGG